MKILALVFRRHHLPLLGRMVWSRAGHSLHAASPVPDVSAVQGTRKLTLTEKHLIPSSLTSKEKTTTDFM